MDDDELRRRSDDDRGRLPLSRRDFQRQANPSLWNGALVHRQPARALVTQSHRLPHRAISRRRGRRHLHPAHHRVYCPQSPPTPRRLWTRGLCDELRAVAECLGLARGLVLGQRVVAVDRMAILRRAASHVRLHLVRGAAREDEHESPSAPRLARARLFRTWFRSPLRGPRPGQSPRLEQQRARQRPFAFRRPAHARLCRGS
jgi:hypothetical protein